MLLVFVCFLFVCVFTGALLSRELRTFFPPLGLIRTSVCLSGHVLMSRLRLVSEINSTQS